MEEKDTKKIAVCDGGKTRLISKQKDFQLEKAANVEIKEPEWLVPGSIPKYGITTIAGVPSWQQLLPVVRRFYLVIMPNT